MAEAAPAVTVPEVTLVNVAPRPLVTVKVTVPSLTVASEGLCATTLAVKVTLLPRVPMAGIEVKVVLVAAGPTVTVPEPVKWVSSEFAAPEALDP